MVDNVQPQQSDFKIFQQINRKKSHRDAYL